VSNYFSPKEAAEDLQVALSTWYKLVAEDDTYPRPFKVGGSVKIDRAAHDAWKQEQQAAANWAAYTRALRKSGGAISASVNGLGAAAKRLAFTSDDVDLHRLVFSEHSRLSELAADLDGAEEELAEACKHPSSQLGGLIGHIDVVEMRRDATCRLSKAKHAAQQLSAIEACFSQLFGLDIRPTRMAWNSLPPAVKRLAEIEEAKRMAETEPDEEMNEVL